MRSEFRDPTIQSKPQTECRRALTTLRRGLLLLAILCFAGAIQAQVPEFRAAWADVFNTTYTSSGIDTMVSRLVTGHYNAVIIQMVAYMDSTSAASHGAHYQSDKNLLPWSTTIVSDSYDPLAYLCTKAHAAGIEVHAWLGGSAGAMYRVSTVWPPAGNPILTNNPKWFIAPLANSEGGSPVAVDGCYDLDMGSPDAQEYIVSIVKELVTKYPIDGINWDDELNSAGYNAGFGYPAYSQADYPRSGLARFRINNGYPSTYTPANDDPAWSNYRRRFKNELMARVQAEIQSIKTNSRQPLRHTSAALAYSPVPTNCDFTYSAPYTYYCDWAGMLSNAWVDAVIPQTYSSSTFNSWADKIASCWQFNRQIFPGIGAYLQTDATIKSEITYTRSKGLKGNCIYSYAFANNSSPYNGDWWAYVSTNLYTNVVSTPPMPWRNPATATEGIMWGRVLNGATGLYVDDATVTVTGVPAVKTDGNGYYVATLVPASSGGTVHSTTASKTGATSQTIATATVLPGDVVCYNFALNGTLSPFTNCQPVSQTVTQGSNATFAIIATGSGTLHYQWRFFGTNLDGATASSYTRTNAQPAHEGDYLVVVTNSYGAVTSSTAHLTVIQPPDITTAPLSQTVTQNQNATFTVAATGAAPLSFQWRFNGGDISGATGTSYTRTSVQPADAGTYSILVTNNAGTDSASAILTVQEVPTLPSISTQPQSQSIYVGQNAAFSVTAAGSSPLSYQWRFNGDAITGATTNSYTKSNAQTADAGSYTVVVTNNVGSVTSQMASLTVSTAFQPGGLNLLWSLAPGSRPYLTISSLPNERGLACNNTAGHLLVVTRSGPKVYVLDANTGADVNQLSVSGVSGGTYVLLMIGVGDDGVVYAGNLTTAGTTTAFKLYRWSNDNATTVPTVAYSGDPGSGNSQRWGDTIDVRGAGANTQIIIGSRSGNNVAVLTTTDGVNFTAKTITVSDSPTGSFGLGIAFGPGNTFWSKATSTALRQVSFDLNAGTGSTLHSYADPIIPNAVAPLGVNTNLNTLAGINVGASNNHLRLYDLTPMATNGNPALVATSAFATDNDDSGSYTGSVDFNGDKVYALCANNGIIALQITPAPVPPAISTQPADQSVNQGGTANFSVTASGTPVPSYYWRFNDASLGDAATSTYTRANVQPGDAGSYSVIVSNIAGAVTSREAVLTVNVMPSISNQPQSRTNNAGTDAAFSVTAAGSAPLSYQWLLNGASISDATGSGYTRPTVGTGDAGSYSVVITNMAGSVTSADAVLTVNVPPAISSQPDSRTNAYGTDAGFSVTAGGTAPLSYQWRFNGADITGATGSTYMRANVHNTDAGSYSVVVANMAPPSQTSGNAILTVLAPAAPHIDSINLLPDKRIRLQVSGSPGQYGIDGGTEPSGLAELTNFTTTVSPFEYFDSDTNLTHRFYRARLIW